MRLNLILIVTLVVAASPVVAAREMTLSLDDAIIRARTGSVDAAVALDRLRTAHWEWRAHRAELLPEVTLNATLPTYADRYSSYMNDEGQYSFVRNRFLEAQTQLSVTQNIKLTGGSVSLISSLDFLRQFDTGNRFMTIPLAVTLNQPLFGVNRLRWNSRIEPERYAEALAEFMSASEDVAMRAVSLYFALLLSRENVNIATQNLTTAERLYNVAVEKRKMGSISQNDLLQMEINLLDARAALTDCRSTMKSDMFALRSFLALDEDVEIIPIVPTAVPLVSIDYDAALQLARTNNKIAASMRRQQLEADYEVARARGDQRQVNLFAQLGYTGTDSRAAEAYRRLRGNQMVEVGVSIPLLDWGKRRGRVKVAESNRRVTESRLRQEAMEFDQDLFVLVERFGNQQEQLQLARRTDEIATRRYDSNVETFMIGKISTLDLNDSRSRKDESRRHYVTQLYKFWLYWYQLRSLTLYDFEHHCNINTDVDKILTR